MKGIWRRNRYTGLFARSGRREKRLIILETLIALGILAIPLVRFGRLARLIDFSTST